MNPSKLVQFRPSYYNIGLYSAHITTNQYVCQNCVELIAKQIINPVLEMINNRTDMEQRDLRLYQSIMKSNGQA